VVTGVAAGVVAVRPGMTSVPSGIGREPGSGTAGRAGASGAAGGAADAGSGLNSVAMAAAVAAENAIGCHHGRARCSPLRAYCLCVAMRSPSETVVTPSLTVSPYRSYPTMRTAVDRSEMRGPCESETCPKGWLRRCAAKLSEDRRTLDDERNGKGRTWMPG
jgi:hypothetical protein